MAKNYSKIKRTSGLFGRFLGNWVFCLFSAIYRIIGVWLLFRSSPHIITTPSFWRRGFLIARPIIGLTAVAACNVMFSPFWSLDQRHVRYLVIRIKALYVRPIVLEKLSDGPIWWARWPIVQYNDGHINGDGLSGGQSPRVTRTLRNVC
jgi:hypothetical protein